MAAGKTIFSGEPLPLAPDINGLVRTGEGWSTELDVFHRKLLDYLRRLGAKLNRFVGAGGAVEAFAGTLSSDQATVVSYTAITWNNSIHLDPVFVNNGNNIQVLVPGLYVLALDLQVADLGFTRGDIAIAIVDSSNNVIFYPEFGFGRADLPTYSMTIAMPLLANTRIATQLRVDVANAAGLLKAGTRLTILRITQDATGGGGIGFDDPDENGIPSWGVAGI